MSAVDPYADALRLVGHAQDHTDTGDARDDRIAELTAAQAQVRATLALVDAVREMVPLLREVGDQLDTVPRQSGVTDADVMRCGHGAVICGLCGYGVPAGDGGR